MSATLGLVLKIVLLPFIILSLGIVYFLINGPDTQSYCMIVIPALWRDTPGPTWQLVAAMFGTSSERLKKGRQHHRHSSVLSSTLDRLEFVLVERSDVPGPR